MRGGPRAGWYRALRPVQTRSGRHGSPSFPRHKKRTQRHHWRSSSRQRAARREVSGCGTDRGDGRGRWWLHSKVPLVTETAPPRPTQWRLGVRTLNERVLRERRDGLDQPPQTLSVPSEVEGRAHTLSSDPQTRRRPRAHVCEPEGSTGVGVPSQVPPTPDRTVEAGLPRRT